MEVTGAVQEGPGKSENNKKETERGEEQGKSGTRCGIEILKEIKMRYCMKVEDLMLEKA